MTRGASFVFLEGFFERVRGLAFAFEIGREVFLERC